MLVLFLSFIDPMVISWQIDVYLSIIICSDYTKHNVIRLTPLGEPPSPRAAHVATAVGTMVVIQVLYISVFCFRLVGASIFCRSVPVEN